MVLPLLSSLVWGAPGGVWTACCLAAACLVLIVFARRDAASAPQARQRALVGMRVASALLLFLVAARPGCSSEHHEDVDGQLVLLFDASRSLTLPLTERSRAEEAAQLVSAWSGSEQAARAQVMRFGAAVESVSLEALAGEYPSDEGRSRLLHALRTIAQRDREAEVGAIVVISDGADSDQLTLPDEFELDGVRVHAVTLGDGNELVDDSVREVAADHVGFLRQPLQVRVQIATTSTEDRRIPVRLWEGDELLREELVHVPARGSVDARLEITPARLGRMLYRVSIPIHATDAVPSNNERSFLVNVRRDKLRVLLVTGRPSWDVRFLRVFLKRDPAIDLISFFILRTVNDLTMAPSEELALIPFPTDELFREHLGSFDVIFFQNFDYAPYEMGPYLDRIREYVVRGGAFAMIGGDRAFGPGGYAGTPIETILPVGVPPASMAAEQALIEGRFRPQLVTEHRHHPLVNLLPDEAESVALWSRLSPLAGANQVTEVFERGRVLLRHPSARAMNGGPLPILVTGTAGEGRVLALMADTSWHWGMTTAGESGDASAYERFWDRALRWLSRDPALEAARVTTDQERYAPGARMRIDAVVRDDTHRPHSNVSVPLRVLPADGDVPIVARDIVTDREGRFSLELNAPSDAGGFRISLRDPEAESAEEPVELASEWFVVEEGGDELADPSPRPAFLEALAAQTGGSVRRASDRPPLSAFDTHRSRSLGVVSHFPFSSWPALLGFAVLLGVEWSLRRRWGRR